MKNSLIILLAGNSTRFSNKIKKQFFSINNKPLIYYTISSFEKSPLIDEISLVCQKEDKTLLNKIIEQYNFKKIINIVIGGKTRQESVKNAIDSLSLKDDDNLLIHDGARPLVSSSFIENIIKALENNEAATAAIKMEDTIAIANNDFVISSFEDREKYYRIQTPQAFKFGVIKMAHELAKNDSASDDAQLVKAIGKKVAIVLGDKKMFKVTTLEDAFYIESIVKNEQLQN